jgi:hypothetical protein
MIEHELYITEANSLCVRFPKEPPMRERLLADWLDDGMLLDRDLDRYLERFAQVEAGVPEVRMVAYAVISYISKERVLLVQDFFPSPEEEANPATTELSFEEAKALILMWRDAKAEWRKKRSESG